MASTQPSSRGLASSRASNSGDLFFGWIYSAFVGGTVVALIFLFLDVVQGHPLLTPSILGSVAFKGVPADAVTSMDLSSVAGFTMVHILVFGVLGLMATVLHSTLRAHNAAATIITTLMLFVLMEGGMWVASSSILPGTLARLGTSSVFVANVAGSMSMGLFLHWAHAQKDDTSDEREEDLVETPGI